MAAVHTEERRGSAASEGLYHWDDPSFDTSRDIMHTPGTLQYLGPSPEGETAHGLPNEFPHEVVERHR